MGRVFWFSKIVHAIQMSRCSRPRQSFLGSIGHQRRLCMEPLEDRRLLSVFTVNKPSDAAVSAAGQHPGSLRQAIFDANANPGPDTISFDSSLSGGTITLSAGELRSDRYHGHHHDQRPWRRQVDHRWQSCFRVFMVDRQRERRHLRPDHRQWHCERLWRWHLQRRHADGYRQHPLRELGHRRGRRYLQQLGTLTVTDSSLSGNSANHYRRRHRQLRRRHLVMLTDSTLSNNSAKAAVLIQRRHADGHRQHPLWKLGVTTTAAASSTTAR